MSCWPRSLRCRRPSCARRWRGWSRPSSCSAAASRRMRVYTFKHALVQETAYRAVLRERREELHARIARTLAARLPRGAGEPPRADRPSLHRGRSRRGGGRVLARGGRAGDRALGGQGGGRPSQQRAAGAGQVPRGPPSQPHRARPADQPRRGADRGAQLRGARDRAGLPARLAALPASWATAPQQMPALFGRWIHHVARAELDAVSGGRGRNAAPGGGAEAIRR